MKWFLEKYEVDPANPLDRIMTIRLEPSGFWDWLTRVKPSTVQYVGACGYWHDIKDGYHYCHVPFRQIWNVQERKIKLAKIKLAKIKVVANSDQPLYASPIGAAAENARRAEAGQ